MVETTPQCFNSCIACLKPACAYANPWKLHKLCDEHINISESLVDCQICFSQVKIIKQKQLICDICKIDQNVRLLDCSHTSCDSCYSNRKCLLCEQSCMICTKSVDILYDNCSHFYCSNCFNKTNSKCIICNPNKCFYCGFRNAIPLTNYCTSCEKKCTGCKKFPIIKGKLDCIHTLCESCALKSINYCSICQRKICMNCIMPSPCAKQKHINCVECSLINKYYSCILCDNNQFCDACRSMASTRKCHKEVHKFCLGCDTKRNSIYCSLCKYMCCICSNEIVFEDINQFACGHEICRKCFMNENRTDCKRCPPIRDFYKCEVCLQEFWNKNQKLEIIKCLNCKERICTVCGKKVGFFRNHQCFIANIN